ncbi:glycogen synthase kinase 3 [Reticulomyxa filosa]|uniref:Glycogen synthase kinase 3 n=1 Tax=Reticulomyxa filosa TaxID=46433 RepID=X6MHL9_RETFI|nr:glycogen synthase kinase 3 [Reticulomyxa filosa]|eukprot:ETO13508.1 glycogen synthase kinase 3 [Reticulomyxa filosa]
MPLFQGERSVDQLVEIIKVLGTPSRHEILGMNPNYKHSNFPLVKSLPWRTVFANVKYQSKPVPDDAIDILSKFLLFTPSERLDCFTALAHPYFDELRQSHFEFCLIPGCKKGPELFNFTTDEIELAKKRKIVKSIVPKHFWEQTNVSSKADTNTNTNINTNTNANTNINIDANVDADVGINISNVPAKAAARIDPIDSKDTLNNESVQAAAPTQSQHTASRSQGTSDPLAQQGRNNKQKKHTPDQSQHL